MTDFEYMKQVIQILQLKWLKKFPRICSRKILTLASFSLGESKKQYTTAFSNRRTEINRMTESDYGRQTFKIRLRKRNRN